MINTLHWKLLFLNNVWYNFEVIVVYKYYCSQSTERTICGILSVCIKLWCIIWCCYKGFHFVLQEHSSVTTPKLYSNMFKTRTLRHLLQRTVEGSYLPYRIWIRQYLYRALWSQSTRYMLEFQIFSFLYQNIFRCVK